MWLLLTFNVATGWFLRQKSGGWSLKSKIPFPTSMRNDSKWLMVVRLSLQHKLYAPLAPTLLPSHPIPSLLYLDIAISLIVTPAGSVYAEMLHLYFHLHLRQSWARKVRWAFNGHATRGKLSAWLAWWIWWIWWVWWVKWVVGLQFKWPPRALKRTGTKSGPKAMWLSLKFGRKTPQGDTLH